MVSGVDNGIEDGDGEKAVGGGEGRPEVARGAGNPADGEEDGEVDKKGTGVVVEEEDGARKEEEREEEEGECWRPLQKYNITY